MTGSVLVNSRQNSATTPWRSTSSCTQVKSAQDSRNSTSRGLMSWKPWATLARPTKCTHKVYKRAHSLLICSGAGISKCQLAWVRIPRERSRNERHQVSKQRNPGPWKKVFLALSLIWKQGDLKVHKLGLLQEESQVDLSKQAVEISIFRDFQVRTARNLTMNTESSERGMEEEPQRAALGQLKGKKKAPTNRAGALKPGKVSHVLVCGLNNKISR